MIYDIWTQLYDPVCYLEFLSILGSASISSWSMLRVWLCEKYHKKLIKYQATKGYKRFKHNNYYQRTDDFEDLWSCQWVACWFLEDFPASISRALGYNFVADRYQLTPPSSRENSCGHFPGPEIFLVHVVMKLEPLEISENQTEKLNCKRLDFGDSG